MADISNIHDDGASTKLSDATATTKESDPTSENGEDSSKNSAGM
jgi:hypothetical protein